jgi:hypothetical protein
VSELYILEQLMTRLKAELKLDRNADLPKPSEVFDMICGTSTGGYNIKRCLRRKLAS